MEKVKLLEQIARLESENQDLKNKLKRGEKDWADLWRLNYECEKRLDALKYVADYANKQGVLVPRRTPSDDYWFLPLLSLNKKETEKTK